METYTLIHFARGTEDDCIGLVGNYPTQKEAQAVMKALYESKLSDRQDWDYELCGISGIDAVVQDEYNLCHRWFIFNSDDAGIQYFFS